MGDVISINESELLHDLDESIEDIELCKRALSIGLTEYSGGKVEDRLKVNQKIVEKIKAELMRRWSDNDSTNKEPCNGT